MSPNRKIVMSFIKNERITARVNEKVKDTLTIAANIIGTTLNQFLVQAALEKAETIVEKEKVVTLGKRDSQIFFDALENPKLPNKKLQNAFSNYNNKVR